MSFKRSLDYYEERLKDHSLLLRRVLVQVANEEGKVDRFVCVPCGGDRVTGFTHFFSTKAQANIVYRTLLDSGENFPMLRVEPMENAFGDLMFMVKWGMDEPDRRFIRGWTFEVAIAKQLGYNDECMAAHRERHEKFYGCSISLHEPYRVH